jgi:hypothetical protein
MAFLSHLTAKLCTRSWAEIVPSELDRFHERVRSLYCSSSNISLRGSAAIQSFANASVKRHLGYKPVALRIGSYADPTGASSQLAFFRKFCGLVCSVVRCWRSSSYLLHRNRRWWPRCILVRSFYLRSHLRSSYVITSFFIMITAAILAETCSALPAAGSIYL